jgi:hypothetical protein
MIMQNKDCPHCWLADMNWERRNGMLVSAINDKESISCLLRERFRNLRINTKGRSES